MSNLSKMVLAAAIFSLLLSSMCSAGIRLKGDGAINAVNYLYFDPNVSRSTVGANGLKVVYDDMIVACKPTDRCLHMDDAYYFVRGMFGTNFCLCVGDSK